MGKDDEPETEQIGAVYPEEYGTRESDPEINRRIIEFFNRQDSQIRLEPSNRKSKGNALETRVSSGVLSMATRIVNLNLDRGEYVPRSELLTRIRRLRGIGYPVESGYSGMSRGQLCGYFNRIKRDILQQTRKPINTS